MQLNKYITVSLLILVSHIPSNAQSASYNCENSSTASEVAICKNPKLSHLDDELNTLYNSLLNAPPIAREIQKTQLTWLVKRNSCGKNVKCLHSSYKKRIKFLHDTYVD